MASFFLRYRQYLEPATWNEYVMTMVERFGADFDDPMEEIKKIKQVGSFKEYQSVFERNLTQVYRNARMQEAYLAVVRQPVHTQSHMNSRRFMDQKSTNSKPILPTPGDKISRGINRKTLSLDEINEKRSIGLCYFCSEKYRPGHKCRTPKQLYLLELEETNEPYDPGDEQEGAMLEEVSNQLELSQALDHMEISMHALNGSLGYRTLKVTGYPAKKGLHILIDTGSSHNFIDPELVSQLGCEVRSTTHQLVATANGNMRVDKTTTITWLLQGAEFSADLLLLSLGSCGVVLGVQCLLTLRDIKLNFRKLTMEFWYKGRKHLLRGAGNQVTTSGAGKIAKYSGNESQLCMIQVVHMGSDEGHSLVARSCTTRVISGVFESI